MDTQAAPEFQKELEGIDEKIESMVIDMEKPGGFHRNSVLCGRWT